MITTSNLLHDALRDADPHKSLRRAIIILLADGFDKVAILELLETLQQAEIDPTKQDYLLDATAYLHHLSLVE